MVVRDGECWFDKEAESGGVSWHVNSTLRPGYASLQTRTIKAIAENNRGNIESLTGDAGKWSSRERRTIRHTLQQGKVDDEEQDDDVDNEGSDEGDRQRGSEVTRAWENGQPECRAQKESRRPGASDAPATASPRTSLNPVPGYQPREPGCLWEPARQDEIPCCVQLLP
ncbi:hypothetical protein WN48_05857 [Eufriesea mexicana]|uniref:Uncharacterized protein n=1 Tax=Eufriesea mexicana TaxID=516756 RepID=A0A310SD30_9HYME|nr:hypothetical protein WN48_05857 [Eufriesea mexicana]